MTDMLQELVHALQEEDYGEGNLYAIPRVKLQISYKRAVSGYIPLLLCTMAEFR
jgi:hypothetical protein